MKPTNTISKLADGERALEATQRVLKPEFIQTDAIKQRQWALASGDGFYTYPHVDGSGLCTWVYLTEGSKLWSYLRLKQRGGGEDVHMEFKLTDVYQQYQDIAECSQMYDEAPKKIPELAETHNLLLEPGVLL